MVTEALFVRMQSTPGQNSDFESFLVTGASLVQEVPAGAAWLGIRLGSSMCDIDTFPDDPGTQAQLSNRVAAVRMAMAAELLIRPPAVERSPFPLPGRGGTGSPASNLHPCRWTTTSRLQTAPHQGSGLIA